MEDLDLRVDTLLYLQSNVIRSFCDAQSTAKDEWEFLLIEMQRQVLINTLLFDGESPVERIQVEHAAQSPERTLAGSAIE